MTPDELNAAFEEALNRDCEPLGFPAPPKRRKPKPLKGFELPPEPKPMESAGRALRDVALAVVEDLSQPAARAGFVSSLLTSMLCSRARLGFLPSVAIAVAVGVSVEHLYGMAEDIHAKLTADEDKPV